MEFSTFLVIAITGLLILLLVGIMAYKNKIGAVPGVYIALLITSICGVAAIFAVLWSIWDWISFIFTPK